jgi:LysM repeat protein
LLSERRVRMKKIVLATMVCILILGLTASAASASPCSACRKWYRVRRGDTLWRIARRYNTTVKKLVNVNHIRKPNRIYTGQWLCIPKKAKPAKKCNFWYKVKRGDWLYKIARRYNVDAWCVAKFRKNHLKHPSLIYPGQKIYIPCKCRY